MCTKEDKKDDSEGEKLVLIRLTEALESTLFRKSKVVWRFDTSMSIDDELYY